MPYYLLAFLALFNLATEVLLTSGVGYPRPVGKLKNGAISTTQLVLHPDIKDTAKIGSKITFHFKDTIAQPVNSERHLTTSRSADLIPKMNVGSSFNMAQEHQPIVIDQGLLPHLAVSDGTGGRGDSGTGVADANSASLTQSHALPTGGSENQGLPNQVAVVNFVEFANEGDVPNITPNVRLSQAQDFLPKQKSAAIGGSKKQFSTDDFVADTMLHPPYIQSIEPLHSEPLDHPNHVEIDYPEEIHVEPMHHEIPLYPHIEHPIPVHVEEPVIIHHHEPPPPPPPEPVLIPIPIVTSPPPPPPPPPPCTVHIPVTIHLKGKLAIKMKHCENCDFSKNIETIGPLKVSPINEWKESLAGAVEAQARRIILTANDALGDKRNMPMEADYNEVKEALPGNAAISLDTETPDEEVGTKKDVPVHSEDEFGKQHLILRKDVHIPTALVPGDAYKRGVVISLPKGKALLRCVVSRNETLTEMKHEGRLKDETNKIVHASPGNSIKEDWSEDDLTAKHASANSVIIPQSVGSVLANKPSGVDQSTGDEDYRESVQGTGHASVTDQFLKLFDKDMMISLYKMAVRDIMREFRRHRRKQGNGNEQSIDLRDKVNSLFSQRSELEEEYPGIGRSLVSLPAISQFSQRIKRSAISSGQSQRTDSRSVPREVQKASAGVRRVKLVDTDHPIIRQNPKATFNPPDSLAFHSGKFTDATEAHKVKASLDSGAGEFNGGLTFYGDIDPSNLIDDEYGASNCIDVTCEKQKAFLTRAGSYYEKLDNLALQPYKNFLRGEEKNIGVKNRKNYLIKLPYEEVIPLGNVRRFHVAKYKRSKKRHPNVKRQSIFDALSRAAPVQRVSALEEKKSQTEASRRTPADVSENHENDRRAYPSTIVELYGKLPRVPLKITLNPKGPLAKLRRPITIDLKPPEPGKGPETASAKTNDPNVLVRLENKIFKDDPLDQKAQEKLQAVYADIKKRRRRAIRHHSAALRSGKRARGPKTAREDAQNGEPRTKIIVSLPKELTKLATFGYLRGSPSETVVYRSPSPSLGSALAASNNADFGISRSESANSGHQLGLTSSGVSYVVGEANENKHVAALGQTPNEDARAQVEQFAKSLKALQEQAKQAMVHLHSMQQGEHDPYADIGSRRRFKGKYTHSDVGNDKKKSRNGIKRDPYADMGVTVNQDKRTRINAQTAIPKLHKPTNTSKSSVASDPYADIGGHMVISKRSSGHGHKAYKHRGVKAKVATPTNLSAGPTIRTEKSLKEDWPVTSPLQTKDGVPTGVAAQTLIRHLPVDNYNLKESVHVSQTKAHNNTMESKIEASDPSQDDHDVANAVEEPKDENDQASILDELPKFSAALKNVTPESRKQLFEMRPFQFLKKLKSLSKAGKVSGNKHSANQGANAAGKDPYADLGSAVDSSNFRRHFSSTRSTVPAAKYRKFRLELANAAEDILENAQKRDSTDPDYDPYADLGTSIGLTQNESRMKSKATAEVAKSRDDASSEAHSEAVTSSSEKSSEAHGVLEVEKDGNDIFEKISREAVTKLLDSLKEKGIRIKDPVSLQQKLKAKFDKYRMAIEGDEPDSSTSFVENLQSGGYLKKSKARITQGQSRFINQAASPSHTDAIGDPYADLGSSANGDPLPPATRSTDSAHMNEATDQGPHRSESTSSYTETERVTQATPDQPLVSLSTRLGNEDLEQQAKAPPAMAVNLRTSAINKVLDLGSTSTGIPKLYNETASARVSGDSEMEAGDLAEPLDGARSSDNPSSLDMAIREAAIAQLKRMKDEHSSSSYEHLQSENGVRPTAELSKSLRSDNMKAESSELPVVGMLLSNVGKEVQGPYVDLGATPVARKKTLEAAASPRNNINVLAYTQSKRYHRSEKRKALPAGKKLINRMASKKSMKKTSPGVEVNLIGLQTSPSGKIQEMTQANPLLSETRSPAKVSVEPTKSVEVTDMNSEHTVTPENATNTKNIPAIEKPAGDGARNCLSTDSRQAMQLLRGAAEASVANLAGKASKPEDKDSDPYVWIGTSVPGARKETLSKTLRICGFPTPLQNWEAPVALDAKAVLEQAELRLGESAAPSNSSGESTSAPSNATIQVAPVDPYAQLGTEVSSTRKRSRHPAVRRRLQGNAMNFIRDAKAQLNGPTLRIEVTATKSRKRRGLSSSGRNYTAKDRKNIKDRNKDTKGHAKKQKLNNDPYADLGQVVDA